MRRFLLCVTICILFGSCKVGPNYEKPHTHMPSDFSEDKKKKTFVPKDEDLVKWWKTVFNDPFLDTLLEETLSGSFDYKIALEQVIQARESYYIQRASMFPEIDFTASGSRFRVSEAFKSAQPASTNSTTTTTSTTPGNATIPPSTTTTTTTSSTAGARISPVQDFFQIGFDAVWELDFFGKLQRTAQAAYDTWEATAETARDIKITVLSEVANTYVQICTAQEQLALATQVVQADEELLLLSKTRFQAGLSNEQEVESALSTLEADNATLKVYQTTLKSHIYSLGILLGKEPEHILHLFLTKRPIPVARGKVPAGVPADLLKRRHDIRSAERQLAAATEQVGVAVAQLYPTISLTGSQSSFAANPLQGANVGFTSDTLHKLFKNKARIWGWGALFTVPVFDFGKRLAGIDQQIAVQNQALLIYQKTVITALQEVETALTSYFDEEARETSYAIAANADKKNFELTVDLFKAGLADYLTVNQVKEVWLKDRLTLAASQQALSTDLIAVYKSLGGDW